MRRDASKLLLLLSCLGYFSSFACQELDLIGHVDTKTFYISKTPSYNFAEGFLLCLENGGRMGEPRTWNQNDKVIMHLLKNGFYDTYRNRLWLGATKRGVGNFMWTSDHSPVNRGFTNWETVTGRASSAAGDCVEFKLCDDGFRWSAGTCTVRQYVLCEKTYTTVTTRKHTRRTTNYENPDIHSDLTRTRLPSGPVTRPITTEPFSRETARPPWSTPSPEIPRPEITRRPVLWMPNTPSTRRPYPPSTRRPYTPSTRRPYTPSTRQRYTPSTRRPYTPSTSKPRSRHRPDCDKDDNVCRYMYDNSDVIRVKAPNFESGTNNDFRDSNSDSYSDSNSDSNRDSNSDSNRDSNSDHSEDHSSNQSDSYEH